MGYPVNDAYVATFDYSVNYNLNTKVITITDTSTGANLGGVTGIVFTMTAPNGVTGTLTLTAGGSGTITMPTLNGGVVYGNYTISGVLTDPTSSYTYAKPVFNICKPVQCEDTRNSDGCLDTSVTFFCSDNKVLYNDQTSYVYKDTDYSTLTRDVTVIDPNNVTQVDSANVSSFYISPVVNGRYSFTVINTAIYSFDNSVTVTIVYQASNQQYTAACDINLCEFECPLQEIQAEIDLLGNDGSAIYKNLIYKRDTSSALLVLANLQIRCGSTDVSATITQLEKLLGVKCSCGCGTTNSTLPVCCDQTIVMEEGGGDIAIEQTTAGETTTYSISDITDVINIASDAFSSGVLSRSTVTAGNTRTTTITATQCGGIMQADMTAAYSPNSATEQTMYSYVLPPATGTNTPLNTLSKNGDMIRWKTVLQNQLAVTNNLRSIILYINATAVYTFSFNTAAIDMIFIEAEIVRITSTTQMITVKLFKGLTNGTVGANYLGQYSGTFTLTGANTFYVKSLLASAVASAMYFMQHTVELIKKNG